MRYQRLNRSDVKAFDSTMWGIIADAQAEGWLFSVSTKGHAIGRSPDGTATMSVPPSDKRRSGKNARADLQRWQVQQSRTPADQRKIDAALEQMKDPLHGFSDEQIAENTERILADFAAQNPDDAAKVGDGTLVVLRNILGERETLSRIMQYISAYQRMPEIVTVDLDSETGVANVDSRAWRIQWVFFDAVDHHVVLSGGPKMDDEIAEQYVAELVAARVRLADRTCPTCQKVFDDLRARRAHESAHRKATVCPNCGGQYVGIGRHRSNCDAKYAALARESDATPTQQQQEVAAPDPGGPAIRTARPDAVETIMELLAEVEDLRALNLTESGRQVADLSEQLAAARDEAEHWRKRAIEAEELATAAEQTVTKMRAALGVHTP